MRDDQSVWRDPDKRGVRGLKADAQAGLQALPAGDGVASTRAFPCVGSGASSGGLGSKAAGSVHWDPVLLASSLAHWPRFPFPPNVDLNRKMNGGNHGRGSEMKGTLQERRRKPQACSGAWKSAAEQSETGDLTAAEQGSLQAWSSPCKGTCQLPPVKRSKG